eukprot:1158467-Pelagomonas_calceolata.AAC.4
MKADTMKRWLPSVKARSKSLCIWPKHLWVMHDTHWPKACKGALFHVHAHRYRAERAKLTQKRSWWRSHPVCTALLRVQFSTASQRLCLLPGSTLRAIQCLCLLSGGQCSASSNLVFLVGSKLCNSQRMPITGKWPFSENVLAAEGIHLRKGLLTCSSSSLWCEWR